MRVTFMLMHGSVKGLMTMAQASVWIAFAIGLAVPMKLEPRALPAVMLGDKFRPVWSRDGDVLWFAAEQTPGRFVTYSIDLDRGRVASFFDREAVTSDVMPDGRLLQRVTLTGGDRVLVSVREDGTGARQLTDPAAGASVPASSPEGSLVVYSTSRSGKPEIVVASSDGSGPQRVISSPATVDFGPFSWSPDGAWIAFTTGTGDRREIALMHPDGTSRRLLTQNAVADFNPTFSPDGKRIAYTSVRPGGRAPREGDNRIYVMNADGSGAHQVGDISPIHGGTTWSPSGERLAFNAFGRLSGSDLNVELFEIGVDGTGLRQLTTQPAQSILTALRTDGVPAAQRLFGEHRLQSLGRDSVSFAALARYASDRLAIKDFGSAIAALSFNAEVFGELDPSRWVSLGAAYSAAGERDNAARILRKALATELAPGDRETAIRLLKELDRPPAPRS